jgi:hypothetical protein
MAAMAHFSAVIGMVAFFELLWYLERWSTSNTVLGIIAVISVQRCVFKILIAVFLSREFKHDETNRAWWTVSLFPIAVYHTDQLGCLVQPWSRFARLVAACSRVHCQDHRDGSVLGRFPHLSLYASIQNCTRFLLIVQCYSSSCLRLCLSLTSTVYTPRCSSGSRQISRSDLLSTL